MEHSKNLATGTSQSASWKKDRLDELLLSLLYTVKLTLFKKSNNAIHGNELFPWLSCFFLNRGIYEYQKWQYVGWAQFYNKNKICFLNVGTVFLTAVKSGKLRKAHCSPPLVGEDNSMVFTSHSVPFPATCDLRSLVKVTPGLEMAPRERKKPFHFLHTSDGKQILIVEAQASCDDCNNRVASYILSFTKK